MKNSLSIQASQAGTFSIAGKTPIHRLGFGAMRLTGSNVWGEPKSRQEAIAVLHKVREFGINFIDTADSYGPEVSENLIAEAFYPYPEDLIIATKGGLVRPNPESWVPIGRPEYLTQCVEMSLRRLRKECIELYQLHAVDPLVPIEESLEALKKMQKAGKIRYIGLSNVSLSEMMRAKKVVDFVSIQNRYNISDRFSEDELKYCEKNKLGFIPWFPLASGQLARGTKQLEKVAKIKGVKPAQVALAWLLKKSPVMIPIPGTSSIQHLEENMMAASLTLTQEDMDFLNKS